MVDFFDQAFTYFSLYNFVRQEMQLVLLVLWACTGVALASKCTDTCDWEFLVSKTVEICGTDGENHTSPLSAIVGLPPPWSCYRNCGIDVRHPGHCGCPNDCGEAANRGKCKEVTCVCEPGWGGSDCNAIKCPNECSSRGECVGGKNKPDACICAGNFTGPDCSISTIYLPLLPYGELLPGKYYEKDKYGDDHPIFNLSTIANWNIELDEDALNAMLMPANTWNQSRVHAKVYFSNGNIDTHVHATMKLKGHFARLGVKKSFQLSFAHSFFHLKDIVLKAPSLDGTYMRNILIVEYLRAMVVPSARGSFATLTINGIFWGLYWMREELDEQFMDSRFGNHKGNYYSLVDYLKYYGDDEKAYKSVSKEQFGVEFNLYKQEFGGKSWSDFVSFSKFIHNTTDDDFINQIEDIANIDSFIRAVVVLSAVDDADTYIRNGNNWGIYRNPTNNKWEFIFKDFEETMINPFSDTFASVTSATKAVFSLRLFSIPKYKEQYNTYMKIFLQGAFDSSLPNSAVKRVEALTPFLEGILKNDRFFHITYGLPVSTTTWKLAVKELELFLITRNLILKQQFPE